MTFESIYQEFDAKLRRFILRRVSDPVAVEDVLQNVYVKIHLHIGDLRSSEKLESWIYQITRNAIIDHYSRTRLEDELSEDLQALDREETDILSDLAASVHGMLRCLPEKYRQALVLTEIQGLTQIELAEQLGLSISGAKSRVQRARAKLMEAFHDCCHFEFDHLGKVIEYVPKCRKCAQCQSGDCGDCNAGCDSKVQTQPVVL